jgi:hypothetical protein
LAELVAGHDSDDPEQTRARLIAPDNQGHSVLDRFNRERRVARPIPLSTQSLSDILEAANAESTEPPSSQLGRASSLRGRPLGRASERGN